MATKLELAQSLTIAQLRELAAEQDVSLSGLSTKDDIADAVASGVTATVLQEYIDRPDAEGEPPVSEVDQPPAAPDTSDAQARAEEAAAAESTPPPEDLPEDAGYISPADTEALAEAGRSPADLELRLPQAQLGENIVKKVNPETPTQLQVDASSQELPGPIDVTVTVGDEEVRLRPDDVAAISQRAASNDPNFPGHQMGYSNPNLTPMSVEEKIEDARAYAERSGGDADGIEEKIQAQADAEQLRESLREAISG